MSEHWISLSTARAMIVQTAGVSEEAATEMLVNALKDARLKSRVDRYTDRFNDDTRRQVDLEPSFWDYAEPRSDDLSAWYNPDYPYRLNSRHGLHAHGISVSHDAVSKMWSRKSAVNKGGAPGKWDWEGAAIQLARYAHVNDAEVPTRPSLNRVVADWFFQTVGDQPEDGDIRSHVKRFHETVWPPNAR